MSSSSQEMVQTPDRFRVQFPFGNPDVGFKPVLFDNVPADLPKQQEEIVGDAASLINQMLKHDLLVPSSHQFLHGNDQVQQLRRDQYADLGDEAESAYAADVKSMNAKAREGGLVVMSSSRDAWGHGIESAPAVMVMTAKTPEADAVGYELKLTGNNIAGSEYNAEVLPNLIPGISSVTITESGAISMRSSDGKVIDDVPEDQQKYIRNLLVKLHGKVQRSNERIAKAAV